MRSAEYGLDQAGLVDYHNLKLFCMVVEFLLLMQSGGNPWGCSRGTLVEESATESPTTRLHGGSA